MNDLIKRLNRLVNDRSIPHRARQDIREAVAHLKVSLKQSNGKTYTGTPVKVPLTAQDKRDITDFTRSDKP